MSIRTKLVASLVLLCLADIVIPVPILGIALLYVVLSRPAWFPETVRSIYAAGGSA